MHRLADGERTVQRLVDELGLPQPLVSQHLGRLRAAGLVTGTRTGRSIAYSLSDEHVTHVFLDALEHAEEHPQRDA